VRLAAPLFFDQPGTVRLIKCHSTLTPNDSPSRQGDHIDLWNGSRLTSRVSWFEFAIRNGVHYKEATIWFWEVLLNYGILYSHFSCFRSWLDALKKKGQTIQLLKTTFQAVDLKLMLEMERWLKAYER